MELNPIGYVRSPFKQKFAIPRQPGLVRAAQGEIVFTGEFADPNSLREIEQFSHLWLIFHFHETAGQGWSPTVQPPRLGGRERVGVFASRSTFRPNSLGLSVVDNLGWHRHGVELVLKVGGVDLLDGTPILDIKPYLPYVDSIPGASGGYAEDKPGSRYKVAFSPEAKQALATLAAEHEGLGELIIAVLEQDPRPAWRHREPDDKQYGMTLYDYNIKWRVEAEEMVVTRIEDVKQG